MHELWFTAPDEHSALALASALQDAGNIVIEAPFDFVGHPSRRPARPWTVIAHGSNDARSLAALAAIFGAAHHPAGGSQRWT